MKQPTIYWIDLFSGAGGTSTGIHLAGQNVIACVNHDAKAIASHKANYPKTVHFTEDVRDFKVVEHLKVLVDNLRDKQPDCYINIWASLECTNYSKAKGGLPRDADSRTLAWDLMMYIDNLNPDYLYIENVREFMSWGKLDENGKPVHMHKGCDYMYWVRTVQNKGYSYDWKMLNAADFGAYTSRDRYFGIFAKNGLPIVFSETTHFDPRKKKQSMGDLFEYTKEPWKPVKEVLNFDIEGESIFTRKKPLSEATLKRIYAGLIKFVAGGNDKWILKYNSMSQTGHHKPPSIDEPCPTISTQGRIGVVKVAFIKKYYSGKPEGKVISVEGPAGTITTIDSQALVQSHFLSTYYGNGINREIELQSPTLTTKDRVSKIAYLIMNYSNSDSVSIDNPAWTITGNPKHNLVTAEPWIMDTQFSNIGRSINEPSPTIVAARKMHYLLNPQYQSKGSSIENPAFTLIARMDKRPPYFISTEQGQVAIAVFDDDTEMTIKIKEFMAIYGIIDIKMRMLLLDELKKIQGFPKNYELKGTQTDQKKQIGNAVVPLVAQRLVEANFKSISELSVAI